MLLRSGKKLEKNVAKGEVFRLNSGRVCRAEGKANTTDREDEGLCSPPPVHHHVSKENEAPFSKMNALGLITVDSVDWVNRVDIRKICFPMKYGVHSTVSGFIRPDILLRIKKNSATLGASVCLIHHIITENLADERIILPVNYLEDKNMDVSQCYIRLCYDPKTIDEWKKGVPWNPREPVEFVTFVDMQNNCNPNDKKGLFTKIIRALENNQKIDCLV